MNAYRKSNFISNAEQFTVLIRAVLICDKIVVVEYGQMSEVHYSAFMSVVRG